ncbi:MAG: pyridine nucleotide-disulfide oxidoreductase, partial [Bacteroidales bacterium]|nr:pyridine nucleotide-disulfide oxidoreductase [Bacteroidales bacterium]
MKRIWMIFIMSIVSFSLDAENLWIEAENFMEKGGWVIDNQSMIQMGSPYLLAHGLGVPVEDATTTIQIPKTGTYRVWVRTRDWVKTWGKSGSPGRFEIKINGQPLPVQFGTEKAEWHWQDGGAVSLTKGKSFLVLHDLTGFEGRCDAIFLTTDLKSMPPEDFDILARFRRKIFNIPNV